MLAGVLCTIQAVYLSARPQTHPERDIARVYELPGVYVSRTSLRHGCLSMCRRKSNKPKAFQPTYGTFSKSGAAELESPIGDGDALQSISVIKQRLDATNQDAAELKFLHSVIFGNEGEKKSRKKMLLEFKGLSGRSAASTDAVCHSLQPASEYLIGSRIIICIRC